MDGLVLVTGNLDVTRDGFTMRRRNAFLLVPLKVGTLVVTIAIASLAFFKPLQLLERSHLRKLTAAHARTVRLDMIDEMEECVASHIRSAPLLGNSIGAKHRESFAKLLITDYPGIIAEQWVDPNFQVRWVVTESPDDASQGALRVPDAVLQSVLKEAKDRGEKKAIFTPASRLWTGKPGRRMVVPARRQDKLLGFLIAYVDREKFFGDILADQVGAGYGIIIADDHEDVYKTPRSAVETAAEWASDAEFPIFGITLRARVWPEPELLTGMKSSLIEIALAAGSVIGLLFFAVFEFAATSRAQSKELRQARDGLELRVQERTEELKSLNRELELEVQERKQAEVSRQELSGQLLKAQDEEQRRIARELHDSTSQLLGAIAINLDTVRQLIPTGKMRRAQELLAKSTDLIDVARQELSTITYLLHPPMLDNLGLEGVLPWYCTGFSKRSGISVNVELPPGLGRLPQELELTLFRILQEALTNIHRHSGSSTADVNVFLETTQVTLQVTDHGHGLPAEILSPSANSRAIVGVGIAGMRERVRLLKGHFEIASGDSGTSIKAILPIEVKPTSKQDVDGAIASCK